MTKNYRWGRFLNQVVGSVVVVGIVGVVEVTRGEVTVVEGGRANLNSSRKKMLHSINFAINWECPEEGRPAETLTRKLICFVFTLRPSLGWKIPSSSLKFWKVNKIPVVVFEIDYVERRNQKHVESRVGVKLCRFVGKPRLLLIQQRNFWDFVGKLQEKVRISSWTF